MINLNYIEILPTEYKNSANMTQGEKALLGWIAENTNTVAYKTDGYFKAGYGKITKDVCIKGSNTIKKYITKLQELGYIKVDCGTFGRNSGNKYTLLVDITTTEYKDVCNNTNINTKDNRLDEIISLLKEQNEILKKIASNNVCNNTKINTQPQEIEVIPTPITIDNIQITPSEDIEVEETVEADEEDEDESDQQEAIADIPTEEQPKPTEIKIEGYRKKQDKDWSNTMTRVLRQYKVTDDRHAAEKIASAIYQEWKSEDKTYNEKIKREIVNYVNDNYPKDNIDYGNMDIPKVENDTTIKSMSSMNWFKHKEYENRVYNALKSHYNLIPLMEKGFEVMQTWRQYPNYFGDILQAARHPQGKFTQDQLKYIKQLTFKFNDMMNQCTRR